MAKKKIMAWSKCAIEVGDTGLGDQMATVLSPVGVVKNRSAVLESEDGETLEMKATGGETVGSEKQEGTVTLTCRIIEPSTASYKLLGIGEIDGEASADEDEDVYVTTHVVSKEMSVKITPNKIGAKGIEAPKCSVSCKIGWSEEDGNYIDLSFSILHGAQTYGESNKPYWYKKFTSKGITASDNGNISVKDAVDAGTE